MKIKSLLLSLLNLCFCFISFSQAQNCQKNGTLRQEVHDTISPNSSICHIVVHRRWLRVKNQYWDGTASFISPNVLISAGHLFVEGPSHGKILGVDVYIGQRRENGSSVFITHKFYNRGQLKIWCDSQFTDGGSSEHDLSYLALPENVIATYFTVNEFDSSNATTDSVHITGYPGDLDPSHQSLYTKGCKVSELIVENLTFKYGIYTFEGDSGAPIWVKNKNKPQLIGIHADGTPNCETCCNSGIRLTADRIIQIVSFINENKH